MSPMGTRYGNDNMSCTRTACITKTIKPKYLQRVTQGGNAVVVDPVAGDVQVRQGAIGE